MNLDAITTTRLSVGRKSWNVESVRHKHIEFVSWDVPVQHRMYRHYYDDIGGIIFVVDSNDRERMDNSNGYDDNAKEELHRMLAEDELRNAAVLVMANKQDMSNALSVRTITDKMP
mgnify:CR=1 FL=1